MHNKFFQSTLSLCAVFFLAFVVLLASKTPINAQTTDDTQPTASSSSDESSETDDATAKPIIERSLTPRELIEQEKQRRESLQNILRKQKAGTYAGTKDVYGNDVDTSEESIPYFFSHIEILPSGHLMVTETIQIVSNGTLYKKGIERKLPDFYTNHAGEKITLDYTILSVFKDNYREFFYIRKDKKDSYIVTGFNDVELPVGAHMFNISYIVKRQISFKKDFDELYWDATGTGWKHTITKAGVVVILPKGGEFLNVGVQTGETDTIGEDYFTVRDEEGSIGFVTRPLLAGENLTLLLQWKKGFVAEPTKSEKFSYILDDNNSSIICGIGFIFMLVYYLISWRGAKNQKKFPIILRATPPLGLSPATIRFIRLGKIDDKALKASIMNMALKGHLSIQEKTKGVILLIKEKSSYKFLSSGEKAISKILFEKDSSFIELSSKNKLVLKKATKSLAIYSLREFEKEFFLSNQTIFITSILFFLFPAIGTLLMAINTIQTVYISGWLAITLPAMFIMLTITGNSWVDAFKEQSNRAFLKAAVFTFLSIPVITAALWGISIFAEATSNAAAILLLIMLASLGIFFKIMKSPKLLGREIANSAEGFKMYLTKEDNEFAHIKGASERTKVLYDKYMPYAMALDAENIWNNKFTYALESSKTGLLSYSSDEVAVEEKQP